MFAKQARISFGNHQTMPDRLIETVLAVAKAEVGVREAASNWGKRISEYLDAVDIKFPAAWCGAFAAWALQKAEDDTRQVIPIVHELPPRQFAYCPNIHTYAKREGILHEQPQPGDLFLVYAPRARHVGFVAAVHGDTFDTYEGNSNLSGSPEGVAVVYKHGPHARRVQNKYKFVRWISEVERPLTEAPYALYLDNQLIATMPVQKGRSYVPVRKLAERFGMQVGWNAEDQAVTLDGKALDAEVSVTEGVSYAPLREVLHDLRLQIEAVDNAKRHVRVSRVA
jgi:hypothetical protein